MFIAIIFVATAATVQSEAVVRSAAPRAAAQSRLAPGSRDDSARILRAARRAQETFETVRRRHLPREFGGGTHHCDVVVGRWCVWNDETNDRIPPPESARIRDARLHLLDILDSLGGLRPGDEWIASQQVRYLIEAKRHADAIRVADRCVAMAAASYLCRALGALALHDSGAVRDADSAFTRALAAMPTDARCRWTDLSLLLEPELERRYAKLDCAARDTIANAYWRLGAPLFLLERDWRNELLARFTRAELAKTARAPMGTPTDEAYRETALRYGFDTWYVVEEPLAGSLREPTIAGYRAQGPGYNFVPAPRAFAAPADLRADDWALRLRTARAMYAPTYARHFRALDKHQVTIFRRADSALIVAAYDVRGDTLLSRNPLAAGVFTAPVDGAVIGPPAGIADSTAAATGVYTVRAPWQPMIVSLELFDRQTKSAARARYGIRPRGAGGRIQLSDLLLFAPRDSTPRRLADAVPLALATDRVSAGRPLGLFWETYGVRPEGEVFDISLTIERVGEGWMRRAAQRLKLATRTTPLRMQWQEVPDRADNAAARAVAMDVSHLASGRYRIRLTVAPRGEPAVITTREVTLER